MQELGHVQRRKLKYLKRIVRLLRSVGRRGRLGGTRWRSSWGHPAIPRNVTSFRRSPDTSPSHAPSCVPEPNVCWPSSRPPTRAAHDQGISTAWTSASAPHIQKLRHLLRKQLDEIVGGHGLDAKLVNVGTSSVHRDAQRSPRVLRNRSTPSAMHRLEIWMTSTHAEGEQRRPFSTYRRASGTQREDHSTSKSTALLKTCSFRLEVVMLCAPLEQPFLKKAFPRELSWTNTLVPLPGRTSSTFCGACNELALCKINNQDPYFRRWHACQRVG